jgi:hypothetical protein
MGEKIVYQRAAGLIAGLVGLVVGMVAGLVGCGLARKEAVLGTGRMGAPGIKGVEGMMASETTLEASSRTERSREAR